MWSRQAAELRDAALERYARAENEEERQRIAQEVAEQLVALGVRGIWNFTNTELHVGSEVFTEDVHFADSLLTLSYRISKTSAEAEEEGAKP